MARAAQVIVCYLFIAACFQSGHQITVPEEPVYYTYEGSADGAPCHFPFVFNDQASFTPLVGESGMLWCGTVPDIDQDYKWGYVTTTTCRILTHGAEYMGDVSSTSSGHHCQRWDSQTPHSHEYEDIATFPDDAFQAVANKCRNPGVVRGQPFCMTLDPEVTREACNIPRCAKCSDRILTGPNQVNDSAITASSVNSTAEEFHAVEHARLDYRNNDTAAVTAGWCANHTELEPWVQVSLDEPHRFIGVIAQGQIDGDLINWSGVIEFKVSHSMDGVTWSTVQNGTGGDAVFTSLAAVYIQSAHKFNETFFAQYVRIVALSWWDEPCMRFDFEACPDIDDCVGHSCAEGSDCIDMTKRYYCVCPPGYDGELCDTIADNCVPQPCVNGGTCLNSFMNYTCECLDGYYGQNCELGGLLSCAEVALAGATESGYYGIDLGNTGPCEMRPGLYGAWDFLNVRAYEIHREINQTDCEQLCLDDPRCLSVNFLFGGDCFLRDFYSEGLLIGFTVLGTTMRKYCPEIKKLYCLMTNLTAPIMVIHHHFGPSYTGDHVPNDYVDRSYLADYMPLSETDLEVIKANSYSCSQRLDYYCYFNVGSTTQVHFTGRIPESMTNTLYPGDSCECLLRGICEEEGGFRCNCTYHWGANPHHDWDTYTDKTLLPVLGFKNSGLGGTYRSINFDLGPMLCTQPTFDVDECESSPCRNNGICEDGTFMYTCLCEPGWEGANCESDINECLSKPCENEAICLDMVGGFVCQCGDGFNGTLCEIDFNECESNPCQNAGSCIDLSNRWRCNCAPGFIGLFCNTEILECNSSPCLNGGVCVEDVAGYNCSCVEGYGGEECEQDVDECASSPCEHGACGDLLAGYTCECDPGYEGALCDIEVDECLTDPCENGGTCIFNGPAAFTCSCPEGFAGKQCQLDLDECSSSPCVHGVCQDGGNEFICDCQSGYSGATCEETIDECLSDPCVNGRCMDDVDGFACECDPGFTDDFCSTDINECASTPCFFGGTCFNNVSRFDCTCPAGTAGVRCEQNIIDGQWGGWGVWSDCSAQCGNGVRTRMRECNNPEAQNGGIPCPGPQSQVEMCLELFCDNVNGHWGEWSEFGHCSATCGQGTMLRIRLCNSPAQQGTGEPCAGSPNSTAPCQEWECGQPLDGLWGSWGSWGSCSSSCGVGTKSRSRACDDPPAVYGGEPCPGVDYGTAPCLQLNCPSYDDCQEWEDWSECSHTCGSGSRSRRRICRLPTDLRADIEAAQLRASRGMPDPEDELLPGWYWNVSVSEVTYALESCQDEPCDVHKCITCSSEFSGTASSLTCKGPRQQCGGDYPYCMYAFDPVAVIPVMGKGCASLGDCANSSGECENLKMQTLQDIMSNTSPGESDLAPHPDTILQAWHALEERCTICCANSLCNRLSLPPGATIFNNAPMTTSGNVLTTASVMFVSVMQFLYR